jgi:nucleotide-binding universal stress UspA family protein
MKSILVPIDFTLEADNAARYAAGLAKQQNAELTLLYLLHIPSPLTEPSYPSDSGATERENMELLKNLADEIKLTCKITPKLKMVPGFTAREISEEIDLLKADLVVTGESGAEEKFRFLFGSTSSTEIRTCPVPLLIVPQAALFKAPDNILLLFDTLNINNSDIWEPLRKLCLQFSAKLSMLHISAPGELLLPKELSAQIQSDEFLGGIRKEIFFEENQDLEQGLRNFLSQHPMDMLVILHHEHNMLKRIFLPAHAETLIRYSFLPALVLYDGTYHQ